MPTYRQKTRNVEAFKFDPQMKAEDYPQWAQDAIVADPPVLYFLNLHVPEAASAKVVLTNGRIASGYAGDWIAQEKNGATYIIEAKVFERMYEIAK